LIGLNRHGKNQVVPGLVPGTGAYGAATVSRRILYVQAAPAAVALILLWLT
jgi:uncharacterized membrane protein